MTKYKVVLKIEREIEVENIEDLKQSCWEVISEAFNKEIFSDGDRKLNPEKYLTVTSSECKRCGVSKSNAPFMCFGGHHHYFDDKEIKLKSIKDLRNEKSGRKHDNKR